MATKKGTKKKRETVKLFLRSLFENKEKSFVVVANENEIIINDFLLIKIASKDINYPEEQWTVQLHDPLGYKIYLDKKERTEKKKQKELGYETIVDAWGNIVNKPIK